MEFDFSLLLSPEERAYSAKKKDEIARIYSLPDRFLARTLLQYAREAREAYPDDLSRREGEWDTYAKSLVWDVIPEIAHRLGEISHAQGERRPDVRAASDRELRNWLYLCVRNSPSSYADREYEVRGYKIDPFEMLTSEIANGNIGAIALDRISPVRVPDQEDKISTHVSAISRKRGFAMPFLMWTPEMQDYREKRKQEVDFEFIPPKASNVVSLRR